MAHWWDAVIETLRADFSDLPDAGGVARLITRMGVAIVLGGVLGYERESQGKDAGFRTHILVSLGSALFVLIPQQAGMAEGELSRIIQGIATGIGFVGAGAILKLTEERRIEGLTTAAGIWLTAAIGIAAGLGRESTAVLGTLLAAGVLASLGRWGKGKPPESENRAK
jgi:putative Mg2+ transporter-C (MgtC) family protein